MEALAIYTGTSTLHWEGNTSCIFVVEAKIYTPRVKHIDISVFFYNKIDNCLFIPKYGKSSVMLADMFTKLCSDPIISWSTK